MFTRKSLGPGSWEFFEFSLVESDTAVRFRFTWGWFWTTSHNIFRGWKIYMESHMTNMDDVCRDCRGFVSWWALEGRLVLSIRLCAIVHGLLYAPIQKRGTMVIYDPWPNAFGANMPWDVSLAEKVETVQACFTLIEGEGLRAQRDYHTKQTLSAMDEQPIKRLLELSEVIMWHNWISWYVQLGCRTTTILHRHYYKWNIPKYYYYYFSVIAYTHELKK